MSTTMDEVYHERDQVIALAAAIAQDHGYRVWIGLHENDPEWEEDWQHILYIDLPTGQVSWHIHDSELPLFGAIPTDTTPWDGHTVAEKYARLERFVKEEWDIYPRVTNT